MTKKEDQNIEELNEQDLDKASGGAAVGGVGAVRIAPWRGTQSKPKAKNPYFNSENFDKGRQTETGDEKSSEGGRQREGA